MSRFLAGVAAALLLSGAGFFWWRSQAGPGSVVPPVPVEIAGEDEAERPRVDPPKADEKTREERRFNRYDKDRDGRITREEYLVSRHKAYAKLDVDNDGRLSFDEWAVRTTTKFETADADRSQAMSPDEFWTTRVIRKPRPKPECPPVRMERDS